MARPRARGALIVLLVLTSAAGVLAEAGGEPEASYFSFFDGWEDDAYALDTVPRFVDGETKVTCAPDEMVKHRSRALRYAVTAHPEFVARLQRFEALVIELATEHYGRAPRKLVHRGVFACRSLRSRRERISEHALGNAIDLQGFDFGPLPRRAEAPAELPRSMRRAFSVRVLHHWSPKRARDVYHARFLHGLTEALRQRPDIFRGIVGPPRPRHADHLHLDAAPWRYAMFGYGSSAEHEPRDDG